MSLPGWAWRYIAIGAVLGSIAAVIHRYGAVERDQGAQAVRDSLSAVTALRLYRKVDSVGERVVRDTVVVRRAIRQTDTLWQQLPEKIVTRAETVQVLNSLPALRVTTDSAIQACSELSNDCARFRVYADSLDKSRLAQIDALNRRLGTLQPKRYQTVLHWAEIGAAAYLGWRVRK